MTSAAERVEVSPQNRIREILRLGEGLNTWIKKIEPLSREEFPDNIEVNQFLTIIFPRSYRVELAKRLNKVVLEEGQSHEVFQALSILSVASVCGISLVESGKHLTLGQIRKLTENDLMRLDGLSDPVSPRRKIICQLFNLAQINHKRS